MSINVNSPLRSALRCGIAVPGLLGAMALIGALALGCGTDDGPTGPASDAGAGTADGSAGGDGVYLATIRGSLAASLDDSRAFHNMIVAAGRDPENGNFSHQVLLPVPAATGGPGGGDILVLERWNNFDNMMRTYGDPGFQMAFAHFFGAPPTITVLQLAEGYTEVMLPAPAGVDTRFTFVVGGTLSADVGASRTVHNDMVASTAELARTSGYLTHEAFLGPAMSGDPRQFLGIDSFATLEGAMSYFGSPTFQAGIATFFTGPPESSVWTPAPAEWATW